MPIRNSRWLPPQVIVLTQDHMGENWEICSSLKLHVLHWLNLNCASIIGRPFTNFVFFMLTGIPRWLPLTTKSRDSLQTSFCARYSEKSLKILKITKNSEEILNITENSENSENSEQILNRFWTLLKILNRFTGLYNNFFQTCPFGQVTF